MPRPSGGMFLGTLRLSHSVRRCLGLRHEQMGQRVLVTRGDPGLRGPLREAF